LYINQFKNNKNTIIQATKMSNNRTVNLQKLVDRKVLSQAGHDWFLAAVDPFHDFDHTLAGYPDMTSALSLVVQVTKTLQIDKPTDCTGNWDCVMSCNPFITVEGNAPQWQEVIPHNKSQAWVHWDSTIPVGGANVYPSALSGYEVIAREGDVHELGTFMCFKANAGEQLVPDATGWNPTNFEVQKIDPLSQFLNGRVIGLGFEAHNTTAPVYQQGTVTCGEIPTNMEIIAGSVLGYNGGGNGNVIPHFGDILHYNLPPGNLGDAARYPSMRQWNASEGCMCVSSFSDSSIPIMRSQRIGVLGTEGNQDIGNAADTVRGLGVIMTDSQGDAQSPCVIPVNTHNPFAYFSGLSNETTITVSMKMYYEVFPSSNTDLVTLSTMSPPMDNNAIQLYSYAVHTVPLVCPVHMNSAGDFFKAIAGKFQKLYHLLVVLSPLCSLKLLQ
jgi:hypothetical protein